MISEIKIDDDFPIANFVIDGYNTPYREDIPSSLTLREKCSNTEFSLVRIFLYLDWIRRFTE